MTSTPVEGRKERSTDQTAESGVGGEGAVGEEKYQSQTLEKSPNRLIIRTHRNMPTLLLKDDHQTAEKERSQILFAQKHIWNERTLKYEVNPERAAGTPHQLFQKEKRKISGGKNNS